MTESGPSGSCLSDADRKFAESHRVARLATADANGEPHVVPVCYACHGGNFYFVIDEKPKSSRTGLKRLRNLRENPQVALIIDHYSDDWSALAYLLVRGTATLVENEVEYTTVLAELRRRYPPYIAMELCFASHPMVRITPQRRHAWAASGSSV